MFDVVILAVKPELPREEFDTLLPIASLEKQARIQKFGYFRDAQNCLLADVLTRTEICRIANFTNEQLEFSVNAYGKPYLANNPGVHFNVSHTGNYVACALSDEPVGIDIELIKPFGPKIAERFFAPDEKAHIAANGNMASFYEVWTKKESRIKWEGIGLSKPLSSFSVFESDSGEPSQPVYHKAFQNSEAICHVCSAKQFAPSVRVIETAEFMCLAKNIFVSAFSKI
jgi:4'-phosphopantetheinyl transferase